MYTATECFIDGVNGEKLGYGLMYNYNAGDTYPNGQYEVSEEHIKYLLSNKTSRGHALIKADKPEKQENEEEKPKRGRKPKED